MNKRQKLLANINLIIDKLLVIKATLDNQLTQADYEQEEINHLNALFYNFLNDNFISQIVPFNTKGE